MTKYVVDASVCLKWVIKENDFETARNILRRAHDGEFSLLAPELLVYEIVNALSSGVLRGKFTKAQSLAIIKEFLTVIPTTITLVDKLPVCIENCLKYGISGYDSAYVTLAKDNGLVLISSDLKLVTKINDPAVAVFLNDF
jgi:predicted nucleic acid-binding protein